MTTVEHEGLVRHGLGRDIGKPSQLADVFRQGVKWGQSQEREACAAMFDQLEQQRDELLAALERIASTEVGHIKDALWDALCMIHAAKDAVAKAKGGAA